MNYGNIYKWNMNTNSMGTFLYAYFRSEGVQHGTPIVSDVPQSVKYLGKTYNLEVVHFWDDQGKSTLVGEYKLHDPLPNNVIPFPLERRRASK
jgi:hypothetical protein